MFCCATDYWCKENVDADVLEDFSELLFMNSNEKIYPIISDRCLQTAMREC